MGIISDGLVISTFGLKISVFHDARRCGEHQNCRTKVDERKIKHRRCQGDAHEGPQAEKMGTDGLYGLLKCK